MTRIVHGDAIHKAIAARAAEHRATDGKVRYQAIATEFGVSRGAVYRWDTNLNGTPLSVSPAGETLEVDDEIPANGTLLGKDVQGDKALVEFISRTEVVTEEDALRFGQVDTARWYVKRMRMGAWQTPMKVNRGQGANGRKLADKPVYVQLWKVTLELELIAPKPQLDAMEAIFLRMEAHAPVYRVPRYSIPQHRSILCVLAMEDVHFAKLCWARETGQNYDLAIAERYFRDAVEDLLADASAHPVTEILLPIGSDLIHVDSPQNTTTKGTPQDVDGRFAKIIETVEASLVWAIEMAAQVAPVRAVWVPGNHDFERSYQLSRTLRAWFHRHKGVEVDCEPTPRKYHRFGSTLIGMTHGDREKRAELPIIMATEQPEAWAATTCREWLCGHVHQSKVSHSTPVDGKAGVIVRSVRSLAGRDAWHNQSGYVSNDQAAEAYLYDKDTGFCANFIARPRLHALAS